MTEIPLPIEKKCARCGHPQSWHTHDDYHCRKLHQQPCYPETAPLRCLGIDAFTFARGGPMLGTPESRCGCPHFIAPQVSA